MLKLYSNIKRYRKNLNMSQQELAEAVGYKGKSMIAQVENGKVDISASMISKFAEVFHCTENDLIGNDDITGPGDSLPPGQVSNEDHTHLNRYHNVSPETRNSIDLLIEADLRKRGLLD